MIVHKQKLPEKSPTLYIMVVVAWGFLLFVSVPAVLRDALHQSRWYASVFLLFDLIVISYFWINGMKDLFYIFYRYVFGKSRTVWEYTTIHDFSHRQRLLKEQPKVALIYVTCNDFIPDALDTCMNQTYPNTHTYILDDSTDFTYQQKIDAFREKHEKTDVIRRSKHLGFKAGNINHFLKKYDNWDYFVLLDSDEIIPNNFIEESIMFFMEDEKLGILQGNHVSTRNENRFMKRFFRGVDAHWATYQSEKELYGFFIFSWPWCLN